MQITPDPAGRLLGAVHPAAIRSSCRASPPRTSSPCSKTSTPPGKAKKTSVFADKLTVPTGMAPGDGGVYVGQADTLLHLKDTRGTGKADERRVLFAGFGTQDTHPHAQLLPLGARRQSLFPSQGLHIKTDVETPNGPRHWWGGGVWRFGPIGSSSSSTIASIAGTNTWGHTFEPWGRSFCTTLLADGIHLILPDTRSTSRPTAT